MIIEREVGVVACEARLGPRNQQTARLENFLPLLLLTLLVFTPKNPYLCRPSVDKDITNHCSGR